MPGSSGRVSAAGYPTSPSPVAAGDLAGLVLTRPSGKPLTQGIPALYTYAGYHRGFDAAADRLIGAAAEEAWVLGPQAQVTPGTPEAERLIGEVRERYLQDYVDQWDGLLKDIGLVPARDIQHAVGDRPHPGRPQGLAPAPAAVGGGGRDRARPPDGDRCRCRAARRLAAAAGTVLEKAGRGDPGWPAPAGGALFRRRARAGTAPAREVPEAYVSRRFAWLRDLVRASEGRPAPLDGVQQEARPNCSCT